MGNQGMLRMHKQRDTEMGEIMSPLSHRESSNGSFKTFSLNPQEDPFISSSSMSTRLPVAFFFFFTISSLFLELL